MTALHRWIVNPIFGRAESFTLSQAVAAAVLAIGWHLVFTIALVFGLSAQSHDAERAFLALTDWFYDPLAFARAFGLWFLGLTILTALAFFCFRISRWGQEKAVTLRWFTLCWSRSCRLGTIVIPAGLLLAWSAGKLEPGAFVSFFIIPCLILTPAALAPRILPTTLKWRPVCPECGHTVAYAVEPRCAECGEPYPCRDRFYRRWAIRRLPWDRRKRLLLYAYVSTLLMIAFQPWNAAWRLANPDRLGRAVRWWLGHALAPALINLLMIAAILLSGRAWSWTDSLAEQGVAIADIAVWPSVGNELLALAARMIALTAFCGFGAFLAYVAPGVGSDVRIAMVKWSLYLSALPLWSSIALALFRVAYTSTYLIAPESGLSDTLMNYAYQWNPSDGPSSLMIFAIAYGVWWAVGFASQPRTRRRGIGVLAGAFAAYLVLGWLVLSALDLRGFEGML